jgi:pimeloyl-ACP methyl ester carboxylesterase
MFARRLTLAVLGLVLCGPSVPAALAQTVPAGVPGPCEQIPLSSGALTKICVPTSGWNGQLVVFVHGYIPDVPAYALDFYDTLADGRPLATIVQTLGYAYATTTYRQNGLAVLEGVEDVRDLVALVESRVGRPARSFLAGVSEGGLVATLVAERFPALFTGAYAICGPIGSFKYEIDYLTDFRVLFDYFFPGVFAGTAVNVLPADVEGWLSGDIQRAVRTRLRAQPGRAHELMRTARAAFDPQDSATIAATTLAVLQYNVLGAGDLQRKLGGNAYDNRLRWYAGSSNDLRLNLLVGRFRADAAALVALRPYETAGDLRVPLVSIHTTADGVTPFAHEVLYALKARPSGRGRFIPLPVFRYGHCAFTTNELLTGLGVLLVQP